MNINIDTSLRILMGHSFLLFPNQKQDPNLHAMLQIIQNWESESIVENIRAFEHLYCTSLKNSNSLDRVFAKLSSSDDGLGLFTDTEDLLRMLSHVQDDQARWSLTMAAAQSNSNIKANVLYGASTVNFKRMNEHGLTYTQTQLLRNKPLWIFMLQVRPQLSRLHLPKDIFIIICKMVTRCDSQDDLLKIYQFMCMITHEGAKTTYNNAGFWTRMTRTTTLEDIDNHYDANGYRISPCTKITKTC